MGRTRYGQNFLNDAGFLAPMLQAADLRAADLAIEVGPGRGILTQELCRQAGFVVAIEVDRSLAERLPARIGGPGNLTVVARDALTCDFAEIIGSGRKAWTAGMGPSVRSDLAPVKVVANLPFYATAPLLQRFQDSRALFERLVLMVQAEVGERILAAPGESAYGALSPLLAYDFEIRWLGRIPSKAFDPAPKVDAASLLLIPRKTPPADAGSRDDLSFTVHAAFGMRRKTLREALGRALEASAGSRKAGRALAEAWLEEAGVEPSRRGETLSLQEYASLSRRLPEVRAREHSSAPG